MPIALCLRAAHGLGRNPVSVSHAESTDQRGRLAAHEVSEDGGRAAGLVAEDVGVQAQGDARVGVTEASRHHVRRDARLEQQGRVGVP